MYEKGRAWIELNMEHLRHNVKLFRALLNEQCALMPAIKANAYGHGVEPIARALQEMGIEHYCVASVEEGVELRNVGLKGQILVLGYTHPQDLDLICEYELTQTIVDHTYAMELESYGKKLLVHVGIDTGMNRLGERSEHFSKILDIWDMKNLQITGVFSHLCTSDGTTMPERAFVRIQEERFWNVVNGLHAKGKTDFCTHLQGSYGILNGTDKSYDYARVGIALYGVFSEASKTLEKRFDLKPVLSLKARIGCVKELYKGEGAGYGLAWHADSKRRIAVAAIGYADGIPRELSDKGHALVCGQKVPIVGRICMDQLLLDVTDIPDVTAGMEAVFIGKSGELTIKAEEMAAEAGTISNEILSRLGERLTRIPINENPCL